MLKKIIAKIRAKIAPSSPAKPAKKTNGGPSVSKSKSTRSDSAPRGERTERPARGPREQRGGERRDDSQRSGGRGSRNDGGRSGGRSGGRGGRGGFGSQRGERRERPMRDETFEHPRSEPIKPVTPVEIPPQDTAFSKLGLNDALAFAVTEMGYTEPTPIQAQAVPAVLAGRDVTGSAQTGTGKTAAFALPILHKLGAHERRLRCLVLEPTRELALQVEEAFQKYSKYTDLTATVVYGGVGYGKQREDLQRGVDVVAATPGRLLDHIEQGTMTLADVEILVLDEVDRMLDMGFLPDVKRIVQQCPQARQTLFFSATLPPELAQLASWALRDPVEIKIGQRRSPAETISHAFYPVVASQKFDLLIDLLSRTEFKSVIIFTRTKMGADRIAHRLQREGHTVGVIHSDRNQRERVEALEGFKSGKFEVLVATDIAARGLDIAGVSHVINYDVPENPEDYVHRIGRTGRANASGDAFTLVTEDDVRDARSIERYINAEIERKKIDGFDYIYSALFDENAAGAAAPAKPAGRLVRGMRGGRR
ncbi:DEAD/DEAH box helicase [Geminisphaera colitermitum]|uniref:DEAD/DEAH box helicase n=1 Tax=Geminisphaera colitermitum TaxID=1148786 RepID=UPI000158D3B3|nr:DEAD/DEAH box helicase [Geminisphaera colitermitum]